jgi:O-antigen/teichoic acid export membrane protein
VLQAFCVFCVAALTMIAVALFHRQMGALLGAPELNGWLLLVPFLVLIAGFALGVNNWMLRFKQFRLLAAFRIAQTVGSAGAQLVLAPLTGSAPGGLIGGGIFGLFSPVLFSVPELVRKHATLLRQGCSWQKMKAVARKFERFPKFVTAFGMAGTLRDRGVVVLLSAFSGAQVVGLYAVAWRLACVPVQLIAASLSPVMFQRLTEHPSPKDRGALVLSVNRQIAMLVIPCFAFLALYSRELIPLVMGGRWAQSGVYAGIFAAPAAVMMMTSPFDRFFDAAGKSHVSLILEISCTSVALLAVGTSLKMGATPGTAMMWLAGVTLVYEIAWLFMIYWYCDFSKTEALRALLQALGLIVVTVLWFLVCSYVLPGFPGMALSAASMIAYYIFRILHGGGLLGVREVQP